MSIKHLLRKVELWALESSAHRRLSRGPRQSLIFDLIAPVSRAKERNGREVRVSVKVEEQGSGPRPLTTGGSEAQGRLIPSTVPFQRSCPGSKSFYCI